MEGYALLQGRALSCLAASLEIPCLRAVYKITDFRCGDVKFPTGLLHILSCPASLADQTRLWAHNSTEDHPADLLAHLRAAQPPIGTIPPGQPHDCADHAERNYRGIYIFQFAIVLELLKGGIDVAS